jgi:hypothetical protein
MDKVIENIQEAQAILDRIKRDLSKIRDNLIVMALSRGFTREQIEDTLKIIEKCDHSSFVAKDNGMIVCDKCGINL